MSFADKKGIVVASGFKLQAAALMDSRGQVETMADRDELVAINAVTDGLDVFVKETKTKYTWDGEKWVENPMGAGFQLPEGGTVGQVLKKTATGEEWADDKNTTYTDATQTKSGLMSAEDKKKVDGAVPNTRKVNGKALSADVTLSADDVSAIPASQKGAASGVAELDASGKVPAAQLPSYVDDVIEGYLSGGKLYKESAHTTEIKGETGKIYVDLATGKTYRWSGTAFVEISASLALGETSSTAFRGDHGKTAYDHSQTAHAPANAEANVQADWNVTDEASDAFIKNKPKSMPANGGNADTVGGHTVGADVPEGAKFTDTTYTAATQAKDGLMAAADKKKVDEMPTITFGPTYPENAPANSIHFMTE